MSTETRKPLQVGQKLWYVPRHRGSGKPREVTVKKIGRIWAELDYGGRINIDTLEADGGQYPSPGRCYLSRADYERENYRERLWTALKGRLDRRYRAPADISADRIIQAAEILGVDLSDVPAPDDAALAEPGKTEA